MTYEERCAALEKELQEFQGIHLILVGGTLILEGCVASIDIKALARVLAKNHGFDLVEDRLRVFTACNEGACADCGKHRPAWIMDSSSLLP